MVLHAFLQHLCLSANLEAISSFPAFSCQPGYGNSICMKIEFNVGRNLIH